MSLALQGCRAASHMTRQGQSRPLTAKGHLTLPDTSMLTCRARATPLTMRQTVKGLALATSTNLPCWCMS